MQQRVIILLESLHESPELMAEFRLLPPTGYDRITVLVSARSGTADKFRRFTKDSATPSPYLDASERSVRESLFNTDIKNYCDDFLNSGIGRELVNGMPREVQVRFIESLVKNADGCFAMVSHLLHSSPESVRPRIRNPELIPTASVNYFAEVCDTTASQIDTWSANESGLAKRLLLLLSGTKSSMVPQEMHLALNAITGNSYDLELISLILRKPIVQGVLNPVTLPLPEINRLVKPADIRTADSTSYSVWHDLLREEFWRNDNFSDLRDEGDPRNVHETLASYWRNRVTDIFEFLIERPQLATRAFDSDGSFANLIAHWLGAERRLDDESAFLQILAYIVIRSQMWWTEFEFDYPFLTTVVDELKSHIPDLAENYTAVKLYVRWYRHSIWCNRRHPDEESKERWKENAELLQKMLWDVLHPGSLPIGGVIPALPDILSEELSGSQALQHTSLRGLLDTTKLFISAFYAESLWGQGKYEDAEISMKDIIPHLETCTDSWAALIFRINLIDVLIDRALERKSEFHRFIGEAGSLLTRIWEDHWLEHTENQQDEDQSMVGEIYRCMGDWFWCQEEYVSAITAYSVSVRYCYASHGDFGSPADSYTTAFQNETDWSLCQRIVELCHKKPRDTAEAAVGRTISLYDESTYKNRTEVQTVRDAVDAVVKLSKSQSSVHWADCKNIVADRTRNRRNTWLDNQAATELRRLVCPPVLSVGDHPGEDVYREAQEILVIEEDLHNAVIRLMQRANA
jgi:hypothetical protein